MTETNPEKTPEIKSTQLEEQPTAVLRETVPMNALKEFFGRAYQAVMAAAEQQQVQLAGPPFALYHGMPTDVVDVEAGFPVAAPFPWPGDHGRSDGGIPSRRPRLWKPCTWGPTRSSPKRTAPSWGRCRPRADPGERDVGVLPHRPGRRTRSGEAWKTLIVWPVA